MEYVNGIIDDSMGLVCGILSAISKGHVLQMGNYFEYGNNHNKLNVYSSDFTKYLGFAKSNIFRAKPTRVPKQGGIQIAFAEAQNPDIAKTNFVEGRRA